MTNAKRFHAAFGQPVTVVSKAMGKHPDHVGRLLRTNGGCTVRSFRELQRHLGCTADVLMAIMVIGEEENDG